LNAHHGEHLIDIEDYAPNVATAAQARHLAEDLQIVSQAIDLDESLLPVSGCGVAPLAVAHQVGDVGKAGGEVGGGDAAGAGDQGLTLVHFSAQRKRFL